MWARGVFPWCSSDQRPRGRAATALGPVGRLIPFLVVVLGERPNGELVFRPVGKFWQPNIEWHDVVADEFARFNEPEWGKIVASLSVLPYGTCETLLTYECRTCTTDPLSRQKLLALLDRHTPVRRPHFPATVHTIRDRAGNTAALTKPHAQRTGLTAPPTCCSNRSVLDTAGSRRPCRADQREDLRSAGALAGLADPDSISTTRRWSCKFPRDDSSWNKRRYRMPTAPREGRSICGRAGGPQVC